MKLLYVGESWLGSCARSLREALARCEGIELEEISEDVGFPAGSSLPSRVLNRLAQPIYRRDFENGLLCKIDAFKPDVLITYKGFRITSRCLEAIRVRGVRTVNVYPDCSPHAHCTDHRKAVGGYDLVISTKPFHPTYWKSTYGYSNRCIFVPQGYDPNLHYRKAMSDHYKFDIVLIATYRQEYGRLILEISEELASLPMRVAIGGYGWSHLESKLPEGWTCIGAVHGREYIETIRSARICLAPLTTEIHISGQRQPGDQDTTRTYELAAAYCFFIHQRTAYIEAMFRGTDLPLFGDPRELTQHVRYYLSHAEQRVAIATSVHDLITDTHSLDSRAKIIFDLLNAA